jgi:hypothetical protein
MAFWARYLDFGLERAAAIAKNDRAVALEANKFVARSGSFTVKSVVEFVADRAEVRGIGIV